MDTVVARIIEIERGSTRDIERAEEASRQKIEAHRLALDRGCLRKSCQSMI